MSMEYSKAMFRTNINIETSHQNSKKKMPLLYDALLRYSHFFTRASFFPFFGSTIWLYSRRCNPDEVCPRPAKSVVALTAGRKKLERNPQPMRGRGRDLVIRWITRLLILSIAACGCGDRRDSPKPPATPSPDTLSQSSKPPLVDSSEATAKDQYILQVGSYRSTQNAENERAGLRKLGLTAYVERAEVPGQGVWFRLRVGPYLQASTADSVLELLKSSGYADAYEVTAHAPAIEKVAEAPLDTTIDQGPATIVDTTRLTRIGNCMRPKWSPRGREIAFLASIEGQAGLFAVGTAGGPVLPLVETNDQFLPTPKYAWDPSADEVAVVSIEEIPWGRRSRQVENIWLAPRKAGTPRKLTNQERYPFEIAALSWSPSGKWIAFDANFGGEDAHSDIVQQVRLVDIVRGQMLAIAENERDTYWVVGWTAGEKLLYLKTYQSMRHSLQFGYEVWSFDPDSRSEELVDPGVAVRNCRKIAYNRSGNMLIYSRFAADQEAHVYIDAIVALDVATGSERVLVDAAKGEDLSAEFDVSRGGRLAFVKGGSLWVLEAEGRSPVELVRGATQPDWSPDGDDLVCIRDGDLHRLRLSRSL